MNLIEARKQAHEGWVRSPSVTNGYWRRIKGTYWYAENGNQIDNVCAWDLDDEDWEPKPAPAKPFEAEVWVHKDGGVARVTPETEICDWESNGWRKIRVREVVE